MVPRDHRLAASKCVCFDDLLREELLQLPAGTDIQQILDEQARLAGAKLKISCRVGSLDAAVAMTRAGAGYHSKEPLGVPGAFPGAGHRSD
ncbi:MAG: hypothetical protein JWP41_564 [Ramlibacter sp.]|nr:hypothetical protein [Ramlibacter sp.]